MSKKQDETGKRYGRLEVIVAAERQPDGVSRWLCRCDCGNELVVRGPNLRKGMTKSCGCYQQDRASQAKRLHGATAGGQSMPEYRVWKNIRTRCNSPTCKQYSDYGGRGIKLCERWNDFATFLADMGPRPSGKHQIDRIDNDGDYEPGNCRWVTSSENCRNKSNNRLVALGEEVKPLVEWCEQFNQPYQRTLKRLKRGWTPEKALTT